MSNLENFKVYDKSEYLFYIKIAISALFIQRIRSGRNLCLLSDMPRHSIADWCYFNVINWYYLQVLSWY